MSIVNPGHCGFAYRFFSVSKMRTSSIMMVFVDKLGPGTNNTDYFMHLITPCLIQIFSYL